VHDPIGRIYTSLAVKGLISHKGTNMVKNGEDLTRITNDELEKFRLNFSSFPKRDIIHHEKTSACTLSLQLF